MNHKRKPGYAKFDHIDGNKRKYRYLLRRIWDENLPQVTFVMLNPSKAGAEEDDPTLIRCIKYANSWGYGSLEVVNLFAYITTDPKKLKAKDIDPVGSKNDLYILSATKRAEKIILGWGAWLGNVSANKYPRIKNREKEVLSLINCQKPHYCLKLTKNGYPNHPVYLPKNIEPIIFPNRK
ncbi:DUF1643 domain-containing protein [Nostoc sp. PCC 7107]|uniref:DUF1643 domain-containing protein n=1 Tax=Nostoc sp. PCC 7107 TaxID=317936 RepID=UPI00029EE6E7|nr:DUF1643 domain-containing protein [Nostoc sp. PCC 7107]AFY42167.1 protein of unknown function DUF1643 [Nostoc sp. PCC 7107]